VEIIHYQNVMHRLHGSSRISIVGGKMSGTLESEWMGDNLDFVGEVFGHILTLCVVYDSICHIIA
jgi:hypothetical protein